MSVNNNKKGPIFDPGTCRCCGATKKCRLLNIEYEHFDKKEIYSDMFVECFGLVLSHLDGEPTDRLICAMCVARLREASLFRRQVLQCEEKLLQSRIHVHVEGMACGPAPMEIKTEVIIKEEVADEMLCEHTVYDDIEISKTTIAKPPAPLEPPKDVEPAQPSEAPSDPKEASSDHLKSKKQLLGRIQKTKEKLKKIQRTKEKTQLPPKSYSPPPSDKFIDVDSLSFHNNVMIIESSFACPFQTAYSSYYCAYCKATFGDPSKLRDHVWKHDPKTFKNVVNCKKPTYLDIERIDCRLCEEKIDSIDVFKRHITDLHGIKLNDVKDEFLKFRLKNGTISCTECEKSFVFFHALKRHMAEHFGSFVCDICGAHYFDKRTLDIHNKNSHGNDEKYSCHECGKLFKNKHTMFLHVSSVHKKEAAYQCSKCDATLFSYKDRYKHMLETHGEAPAHSCDSCGKVYSNRKNLREHNRTVHLRIFKHCCSVCGRGYAQPQRLADHVVSMHRSGRTFHCELCGNSYPRLHYLKLHIQTHAQQ